MKTLSRIRSKITITPSSSLLWILFTVSVSAFCCIAGSTIAYAGEASLGWDKTTESGVAGYKIYYGTATRNYTQNIKVSSPNITTCTILNLVNGQKYYFAATAYNAELVESDYSAEVSATINSGTTSVPATTSSTSSVIPTTSVPTTTTIRLTTSSSTSSVIPTTSVPTTTTSAGATTTTPGATVYFGNNKTATGFDEGDAGYSFRNVTAVFKITGAGTYTVKSLEAYFREGTGRLAIYDSSGNFIMQGDSTVSSSGSAAWYGHTQFVNQAKTPIATPQLRGETNYILVVSFAASPYAALGYTAGSSGNTSYIAGNYSSGYPATIGSGTNQANLYCIRCQVQAAAVATTSSVIPTTSVPTTTTIRLTTSSSTSSVIPTTSVPTTTTSAGATTTTPGATVYFGNNKTATGFDEGDAGYSFRNVQAVFKITGAGTYTVKSLEAYFREGTGRLAIYDSSGNFIMQGDSTVSSSGSAAWYGHTQFVNQAKTPIATPQLQGETNYILVVSFAASPYAALGYTAGSSGDTSYIAGNYSSGYPATIGSGTNQANLYCIRCQVQAAAVTTTTTTTATCTYSISPASKSFNSSGGTGSVTISTQSACAWSATSNASWIIITSNSSGNGAAAVAYSVASNGTNSSRTGTMTIAGKTFTVQQSKR